MLLIENCVKQSRIHGLGVFVSQHVDAGTVVWKYDPMFDVEMTAEFVASLPSEDSEAVYHHAEYMPEREIFRLGNDADIFMNHSATPSLLDCGDEMIALRDLCAGDELTCDYRKVHVLGCGNEIAYRYAAE